MPVEEFVIAKTVPLVPADPVYGSVSAPPDPPEDDTVIVPPFVVTVVAPAAGDRDRAA